jgi:hypothetical protein
VRVLPRNAFAGVRAGLKAKGKRVVSKSTRDPEQVPIIGLFLPGQKCSA